MGRLSAAEQRARAVLNRLPPVPVVGAEVGVFDGRMSAHLLTRPDLTLYMIDRWAAPTESYAASGDPLASADMEAAYHRASMETFAYVSRRYILRCDSLEAARKIREHTVVLGPHTMEPLRLDFAFIDADHSHEAVAADIEAWVPTLKPGGLLCGHDYGDRRFGVSRAVDEACERFGWDLELGADKTWHVRLP